jgi:hypothetical protein
MNFSQLKRKAESAAAAVKETARICSEQERHKKRVWRFRGVNFKMCMNM